MATLNATNDNEAFVARALKELDARFGGIADERSKLDDLLETVIHFRPPDLYLHDQNATEGNRTEADITEDELPDESYTEQISEYTASLLSKIAGTAAGRMRSLKSCEIRSILHHFVALPYPVDDLIEVIREELQRRQAALDKHEHSSSNLDEAIQRIPSGIFNNLHENAKTASSDSLKLFKKMVRSLAAAEKRGKHHEEEDADAAAGESDDDSRTAGSDLIGIILAAAGAHDSEVDFPTQKSDPVEFGRIQELISQYRRIDFESGARLSRFDKEGQRLMAKRMMSRLLP